MRAFDSVRIHLGYGIAAAKTRIRSSRTAPWSRVWYVVEPRDWSIRWDGNQLAAHMPSAGIKLSTTTIPSGVKSQVVHYGSRSLYLQGRRLKCDESNRVVFTWFHGSREDRSPDNQRMIEMVPAASEAADVIVTSSTTACDRLTSWGIDQAKIRTIPLGVDSNAFSPGTEDERRRIREQLGIPLNSICVGSFHKDGDGWGAGDRPKYEKAPDVLVAAVVALQEKVAPRSVHVLLTGPARGYVKAKLDRAGLAFTHTFIPDFRILPPMYRALDLYLVPSRDEGGPKGLLEAMASGIPVVSTEVGMAKDIVKHGENGALASVEDADSLASAMHWLADDPAAHQRIALNGRRVAEQHDWANIASRYATELYLPLMEAAKADLPFSDRATARSSNRAA